MSASAPLSPPARTPEQLREHFEVERELAQRLLAASRDERKRMYAEVYNELFRRVPHHSQLTRVRTPQSQREMVEDQMRVLGRFLAPGCTLVEVGAGDCAVSIAAASTAARVWAIDVSHEIAHKMSLPEKVGLILSDGTSIPVEPGTVDVVYSHQLMEHLHPDDAQEQLANVHRALKPGGRYVCITPNRLTGPHDISKHFTPVAEGFHLVEYTHGSLRALFRAVGFTRSDCYATLRGRVFGVPGWLMRASELAMGLLPHALRRRLAPRGPVQGWFGVILVGVK
jgi:SAM-dependent methyltransferase